MLLLLVSNAFAQINSCDALLDAMLKKHAGKWCHSLTFVQNTYRPNDSLNRHMTWYEAIEFPDRLRIDFNGITLGNAALFRNDTAFRFRKNVLQDTRPDKNDLLLLLGGMYFRSKEEIVKRLALLGYDLGTFSEGYWNKLPVYIMGAARGDSTRNQVWIDRQELSVVRTLSRLSPHELLDMRVESRTNGCGGTVETKLGFYVNGRLDQLEEYTHLQFNPVLDPAIFDPKKFGTVHWLHLPKPAPKPAPKAH
jgi:hypothetical protein